MGRKANGSGLLLQKKNNEKKEIEFELRYLFPLALQERLQWMQTKSREMFNLLKQNGQRKTAASIKLK